MDEAFSVVRHIPKAAGSMQLPGEVTLSASYAKAPLLHSVAVHTGCDGMKIVEIGAPNADESWRPACGGRGAGTAASSIARSGIQLPAQHWALYGGPPRNHLQGCHQ